MPVVHRYDPPERFVAGTVGPPGQRTFFLQARAGNRITSVALEKQQVAVLAERLDALLDEVMRGEGGAGVVPAVAPTALEDSGPLEQPIDEEFRAGTMTLAWDPEGGRVVIEVFPVDADPPETEPGDIEEALAESLGEQLGEPLGESLQEALAEVLAEEAGEDEPEPDELLLVSLPPAAARAFTKRAQTVVAAGRPPCQFCGQPLDAAGHLCPRANGYRRR
ncbi:MAG: FIG01121520: hypothetical protein [uncultured Nocardioidaceae bacterium]|uniref:DUF3090 domain-containing protein n=1 Tax=uncultured Nocardioidaceae bacterium TaxID=253824 RepID=A0A6J4LF85_9ACTN|nr:MAG: FIG01121520: hypothetical protein [uncultured Nocardioidaceae bacterium]